jgi:transposase
MRKNFDSLAALVENQIKLDPTSGDAFIFINKRKNRLKILIWEDSGYWLLSKRLEVGTFSFQENPEHPSFLLSNVQFQMLLDGIVLLKSKQLKRYKKIS